MTEESIDSTPARKKTVVIVDDESNITSALQRTLKQIPDIGIKIFNNPRAALDFLRGATRDNVAAVLTDFLMPDVNGAEIAKAAQEKQIPVAIMSGTWHREDQNQAVRNKVGDVKKFEKPWRTNELIAWVREQLGIPDPPPPTNLEYSRS